MMLGHFEVLGPSRSTRQFSMKVNGCGQTLHIPVRHGVCVRSRNQLAGTLQQIRRHITTTPRSGLEKSSPAGSLQLPVHQTLHIPVRHGVCVRSRNQLAGTLQQIRRHITTTPRSGSEKSSPAGSEKRRLRSATFWSNQSSKQFVRGASQSTPDYYTLRVRILLRSE